MIPRYKASPCLNRCDLLKHPQPRASSTLAQNVDFIPRVLDRPDSFLHLFIPIDVMDVDVAEADRGDIFDRRLELLRQALQIVPCRQTLYSDDKRGGRSSSKLDPKAVPLNAVPKKFELAVLATLTEPIGQALSACLRQETERLESLQDLLAPNGLLATLREDAKVEGLQIRPSGEMGLSHFLKTSLFDHLNRMLRILYPDHSRYWCVIGIGKTGKTDWGLFIKGGLRVAVELKPSNVGNYVSFSLTAPPADHVSHPTLKVVSTVDMQTMITTVGPETILDSWATAKDKSRNLGFQVRHHRLSCWMFLLIFSGSDVQSTRQRRSEERKVCPASE